MNPYIMCNLGVGIYTAVHIYLLIMIVYAVVSWIPSLRGRWTDYVAMLVDPVVAPVRRIIPPIGGFDLSFLVVMIFLQVVSNWMAQSLCTIR